MKFEDAKQKIDHYFKNMTPEQLTELVEEWENRGIIGDIVVSEGDIPEMNIYRLHEYVDRADMVMNQFHYAFDEDTVDKWFNQGTLEELEISNLFKQTSTNLMELYQRLADYELKKYGI